MSTMEGKVTISRFHPNCRCIPEFDHHCVWVACCIGRDNHVRFLVFLLFETAAIALAFYHTLASLNTHATAFLNGDPPGSETLTAFDAAAVTAAAITAAASVHSSSNSSRLPSEVLFALCIGLLSFLGMFGLLLGGLLVFHAALVLGGMNTREVQHGCAGRRTYAGIRRRLRGCVTAARLLSPCIPFFRLGNRTAEASGGKRGRDEEDEGAAIALFAERLDAGCHSALNNRYYSCC